MRRPLSQNVAASTLTAAALLATGLVSVPIIVHELGDAGYGVWSLAMTVLVYVITAEAGVGPAVQRFIAVNHGEGDRREVSALLWSSVAFYALLGLVVAAALQLAAGPLVEVFDVPDSLRDGAESMFRLMGPVILVALLVSALGNVMQGLERFVGFGTTSAFAALIFLVLAAALLASGEGLAGLAWAALAQQVVMLLSRVLLLGDVLVSAPPRLVSRQTAREIASFSLRLQVSVLSMLVNTQTDRLVVGLVAPASTLGQVAIGGQVAEAGRLVSGAAVSPLISRLSITHASGQPSSLASLFARLNRLWTTASVGLTVVGIGVIYPLMAAWLGDGYGDAALYGGFLVFAYGVGMLPSVVLAYLRAVGRPGLEARFGFILISVNVVLTVGLGIAAGATGVVVATAVAHLLATAWFYARAGRQLPELRGHMLFPLRTVALALVAALVALGCGMMAIELLPPGVSLVPVLAGAAAALIGYLVAATGVVPTPANVRALFAIGSEPAR